MTKSQKTMSNLNENLAKTLSRLEFIYKAYEEQFGVEWVKELCKEPFVSNLGFTLKATLYDGEEQYKIYSGQCLMNPLDSFIVGLAFPSQYEDIRFYVNDVILGKFEIIEPFKIYVPIQGKYWHPINQMVEVYSTHLQYQTPHKISVFKSKFYVLTILCNNDIFGNLLDKWTKIYRNDEQNILMGFRHNWLVTYISSTHPEIKEHELLTYPIDVARLKLQRAARSFLKRYYNKNITSVLHALPQGKEVEQLAQKYTNGFGCNN